MTARSSPATRRPSHLPRPTSREGEGDYARRLALAWLLAQRPRIVPIPGTERAERLEENLGAADLRLSAEDLHDIGEAASKIPIDGARYPEALERRTGL